MKEIKTVVIGALFIATGIVLSILTHAVGGPMLGKILLPLHFVVILAGLLLGEWAGLVVGLLTPIISFVAIGMPPISPPIAVFMMPELGTYGFVAGYLAHRKVNIYFNLLITVISGRIIYSVFYYILGIMLSIHLRPLVAVILSFGEGIVGIIIQFLLIPPLYLGLKKRISRNVEG